MDKFSDRYMTVASAFIVLLMTVLVIGVWFSTKLDITGKIMTDVMVVPVIILGILFTRDEYKKFWN